MKEFELINKHLANLSSHHNNDILVNIGDDCAVLDMTNVSELLVSTDTLVSGVHFPTDTPPHAIAYKSLAVNLSDIAAMGGIPKWYSMALTLPEYNKQWLDDFTSSLAELSKKFNISLIGGDTTQGPLSITVNIMGVKSSNIITRNKARPGDGIFVTGSLGEPAYLLANNQYHGRNKLNYPEPRVAIGQELAKYASSAIDISDGLLADLQHILDKSHVSAELYIDNIPVADILLDNKLNTDIIHKYILTGGDEYELLFTAPMDYYQDIQEIISYNKLNISHIGIILDKSSDNINKPIFFDKDNKPVTVSFSKDDCWQHLG